MRPPLQPHLSVPPPSKQPHRLPAAAQRRRSWFPLQAPTRSEIGHAPSGPSPAYSPDRDHARFSPSPHRSPCRTKQWSEVQRQPEICMLFMNTTHSGKSERANSLVWRYMAFHGERISSTLAQAKMLCNKNGAAKAGRQSCESPVANDSRRVLPEAIVCRLGYGP
jgi:hypothetical protein